MQQWNFFFHFNDVICRMTFMFGWKIIDVMHMLHTHIRFWHFLLTLTISHSHSTRYTKINVQDFEMSNQPRAHFPLTLQYHFTIYPQCISHIFGIEVIRYFSWHFWNCHKMKSQSILHSCVSISAKYHLSWNDIHFRRLRHCTRRILFKETFIFNANFMIRA